MRLFVAVIPPALILDEIAVAMSKVDVKLSATERWHVTLAFIGEVPDAEPATKAITRAALNPVGPLEFCGGGRFGSVLWTGIKGDLDGLGKLVRSVRRSLRAHRVPVDDKRFKPHMTLARRVPSQALPAALETLRAFEGSSWSAEHVVLVHSRLGPNPSHEDLLRSEIPRS